jgi:hypothetical protein
MSETVETQEAVFDLQVKEFNLGTLTTNAEAIRDAVKLKLEGYNIENYSGDKVQDAKRDKAELNSAAKKLNNGRLEYERLWMKPFEAFKSVVGETVALIKDASSKIDQVVKDVEQGEKDEKRAWVEDYWKKQACDLFALDQIFDARWLNKTTKYQAIEDEIGERIKKVQADLVILERLGEPEARVCYLETLDLNKALDRADTLKANRERLAEDERKRAEAEAKRKADDEAREKAAAEAKEADKANVNAIVDGILEEEGIAVAPEPPAPEPIVAPAVPEPPKLYDLTLRFTATMDELTALRAYVDEHGLKYEKIA